MTRIVNIPKKEKMVLDNLLKMVDTVANQENYLVTEQIVADKHKVTVEDVILLEKQAVPFELSETNPKLRRVKILNNLLKDLDYYKENISGENSDFTDAIIVKDKKILFLLRSDKDGIEPNKLCLPGGHLERFLSIDRNIIKEVKEETGLDLLECNYLTKKKINSGKNTIWYFLVTPVETEEVVLDYNEHKNYQWLSLSDIDKMSDSDFIFDLRKWLLNLINI